VTVDAEGLRARAVLLDLDKTLVNVEDHVDYCAALEDARAAAGGAEPVAVPDTHWGRCALEAMRLLVALSPDEERWRRASEAIEAHELAGAPASQPMPGLAAFLEALGGRGTAVVTLLGPRAARAVLERHAIVVDHVVARESGLRIKPHPDQVLEGLRLLGASPAEALLVGDSEWDEAAARAAGVAFLGLSLGRARHGFGPGSLVVRDLEEAARLLSPDRPAR
jgi:HAD superfamily hydrolase (TIGR01509 family)